MSVQRQDFQERAARLAQQHAARPHAGGAAMRQNYRANLRHALSFVWAFLAGIGAFVLVRLASHHLLGGAALATLSLGELAINAVFAGFIILAVRMATSLTGKDHLVCQVAGAWLAIVGFHNLSHWAPGPMSLLFSPGFVANIQARTYPNTLVYRGAVFYFGAKPSGRSSNDRSSGSPGTDFTPRGGGAFVSRL